MVQHLTQPAIDRLDAILSHCNSANIGKTAIGIILENCTMGVLAEIGKRQAHTYLRNSIQGEGYSRQISTDIANNIQSWANELSTNALLSDGPPPPAPEPNFGNPLYGIF